MIITESILSEVKLIRFYLKMVDDFSLFYINCNVIVNYDINLCDIKLF